MSKVIKVLGNNKGKLFTTLAYRLNQGVVHALVLQLVAANIITIYIGDLDKEGTNQLSLSDFLMNWAILVLAMTRHWLKQMICYGMDST